MTSRLNIRVFNLLFIVFCLTAPVFGQQVPPTSEALQWLRADDGRLQWINVADWEARTGGLQPVRIPKAWRDKMPARSADRALATAGVALRLRTDSKKLVIRLTFIQVPEGLGSTPESLWELARPAYFDVYRDGKFLSNVPAKIQYYEQDVTVFDGTAESARESEFTVLFPHYYRNAEVIVAGIGVEKDAQLLPSAPRRVPVVLFHGDSITHGHGVTSPRETYVWQTCERANCESLNLGFGGSAWTDISVAEYIASRNDWDALVLMLGTNSFGGNDSSGKSETAEQYGKKYDAFLATVRAKFANKPILCVTPILNHTDITLKKNRNGELPQDYRRAIQQVVEQRQKTDRNLLFLDGLKLINDPLYLMVVDQVHPNMAGSLRIAEGIASVLKPMLAGLSASTIQSH
jgi:lysophospholipase L1-like esterase